MTEAIDLRPSLQRSHVQRASRMARLAKQKLPAEQVAAPVALPAEGEVRSIQSAIEPEVAPEARQDAEAPEVIAENPAQVIARPAPAPARPGTNPAYDGGAGYERALRDVAARAIPPSAVISTPAEYADRDLAAKRLVARALGDPRYNPTRR